MNVCESFTCPCLYQLTNKINVIDKTITKELIGQSFFNRVMSWKYALHLDIFVANNSKCIVISCATCLKSTLKACSLIPPKGNNVCDERTKCYVVFYKVFEDIKKDFSRKKLINCLHLCDKRLLMCNACKSNFICSLKDFLVPFILDEHLFTLQRI